MDEALNKVIRKVRVVAHLSRDLGGGVSDNHWSIYLLLPHNNSVRMNIVADYENPTARLEWTTKYYQITRSAIHYWDFDVASGLKVQHVCDLVYQRGRDKYEFSGGGSGCRYWCYTVLQDLQKSNFVSAGSYEKLWPDLQYQYSRSRAPFALNWVEGTFTGDQGLQGRAVIVNGN